MATADTLIALAARRFGADASQLRASALTSRSTA